MFVALTLTTLLANSADHKLIFFSYFPQKTGFDITCIGPVWGKNKKNISICRLLKFFPRVRRVKGDWVYFYFSPFFPKQNLCNFLFTFLYAKLFTLKGNKLQKRQESKFFLFKIVHIPKRAKTVLIELPPMS